MDASDSLLGVVVSKNNILSLTCGSSSSTWSTVGAFIHRHRDKCTITWRQVQVDSLIETGKKEGWWWVPKCFYRPAWDRSQTENTPLAECCALQRLPSVSPVWPAESTPRSSSVHQSLSLMSPGSCPQPSRPSSSVCPVVLQWNTLFFLFWFLQK